MTTAVSPGPARTTTGAPLPLVALPQGELLTVNINQLPLHYHTGTAQVWTIQGRWEYREYPGQPQVAGSYLHEPGGSVHTFFCPEDNTEETVVLLWMEGAQINFSTSIQFITETLSAEQDTGPVPYIHAGGAAAITTA